MAERSNLKLEELSVAQFLDEVASASPAPGGGSVSALAGAVAAALASMVCRLTSAKPKLAERHAAATAVRDEAERVRQQLLAAVDEDARAFQEVIEASRAVRAAADAEAKVAAETRLAGASLYAAQVPLGVLRGAVAALALVQKALSIAPHAALSDVGVAGELARAAAAGAALNVRINLPSLSSGDSARLKAELTQLNSEALQRYSELTKEMAALWRD